MLTKVGAAVIFVTHDQEEATSLGDTVAHRLNLPEALRYAGELDNLYVGYPR